MKVGKPSGSAMRVPGGTAQVISGVRACLTYFFSGLCYIKINFYCLFVRIVTINGIHLKMLCNNANKTVLRIVAVFVTTSGILCYCVKSFVKLEGESPGATLGLRRPSP
jgi:hypothetical protein